MNKKMTLKEKAIKEAVKVTQNHGLVSDSNIRIITMMAIKKGIDIALEKQTKNIFKDINIIRKRYRNSGYDFKEFDDLEKRYEEFL